MRFTETKFSEFAIPTSYEAHEAFYSAFVTEDNSLISAIRKIRKANPGLTARDYDRYRFEHPTLLKEDPQNG